MLFAATATTKSGTAIQEPESGSGSGTAHNLCKLAHFITAGHISNKIFQGGGAFQRQEKNGIHANHLGGFACLRARRHKSCLLFYKRSQKWFEAT